MFKKISLIAGSILVIAGISFYIISTKNVSGEDAITMEYFNTTIKTLEDKITILETKLTEAESKTTALETTTTTKLNDLSAKIDTNLQTNTTAINNVKTSLGGKINATSTTLNNTIARLDNVDKESNAVMWFMNNYWDYPFAANKIRTLIVENAIEVPTKPFQ